MKESLPAPTVHMRKRSKNLAVFLLVIGWCVLIFLITMAKLQHAAHTGGNTGPGTGVTVGKPVDKPSG